mmetsp:Transcript_84944/g.162551  ORF Transcript_84944/g.162551 Transcript_84944/m.162551 type:complete len:870 (-) Transcript_84944:276-2885(-)
MRSGTPVNTGPPRPIPVPRFLGTSTSVENLRTVAATPTRVVRGGSLNLAPAAPPKVQGVSQKPWPFQIRPPAVATTPQLRGARLPGGSPSPQPVTRQTLPPAFAMPGTKAPTRSTLPPGLNPALMQLSPSTAKVVKRLASWTPPSSQGASITAGVKASGASVAVEPARGLPGKDESPSEAVERPCMVMTAMQAKMEALEREAKETKAKIQAARQEANSVKEALAEAHAAKAEALDHVVACASQSRSNPAPVTLPPPAAPTDGRHLIGRPPVPELEHHWDVVVIGGGPVGVAAAMKAAVLGHRAIIVDKPKVSPMANGLDVSFGGPTGLWSKALRDIAKHVDVPSLQSMHLDDDVIWHQVRNMCLRLATSNSSHQVKSLEHFKISYVQASATVVSAKNVLIDQRNGLEPIILQTDFVLVATGSKPMRPKEIPFDDFRIFDSDTINSLSFLPKTVAVLGAGIISIEYAKIFRKLGCKVYMLVRSSCFSALERIGLDHDIASKLIEVLHNDDVSIFENTTVEDWDVPLRREDGPLKLTLKSKNADVPKQIEIDIFLAATGRVPNTTGWGAEKLGLKLGKKGNVQVDDTYQTSVRDIYAAGDVIGPPSLASTGMYQAQAAMLEMFGQGHMNKFDSFPVGMWTVPECGYYGLTTAEAHKQGLHVREGLVHYDACLRGRVFAPTGLLKLVFREKDGVIVGVHILGDDACEMVHYGMDLVKQEVSIFQVMTTCFTAVTYHELFKEAAMHGNSMLEFGLEWHKILEDIGEHIDNLADGFNVDRVYELFHEADTNKDGLLNGKELLAVFHKYGCMVSRSTANNLVRLSAGEDECEIAWEQFSKIFDILDEVRENSHFGAKDKVAGLVDAKLSSKVAGA